LGCGYFHCRSRACAAFRLEAYGKQVVICAIHQPGAVVHRTAHLGGNCAAIDGAVPVTLCVNRTAISVEIPYHKRICKNRVLVYIHRSRGIRGVAGTIYHTQNTIFSTTDRIILDRSEVPVHIIVNFNTGTNTRNFIATNGYILQGPRVTVVGGRIVAALNIDPVSVGLHSTAGLHDGVIRNAHIAVSTIFQVGNDTTWVGAQTVVGHCIL